MMLIDLHTHSAFSPDAEDGVQAMIDEALDRGVQVLAITDHCDCNFWETAPSDTVRDHEMYGARFYAKASISRVDDLKKIYRGRINLLCGTELGQPLQNTAAAEKIVSDKRLDFTIGSHHMNRGRDDFYWLEYEKMDSSEMVSLLDDYFEEVLEMCRWDRFDVLGHLTYPLRYITERGRISDVDMKRYDELIRQIFWTLIHNGKGIEINTSGLRQPIGKTLPDLEYVKLYYDMGGRILTVGSDAHKKGDICAGIAEGIAIAKQAGFTHLTYFEKHSPNYIQI
ncbi:MAG: histidinol-phosphatase HisJ family protein [Ruminococcus sp.]|nr:histidinol-phosphatase HisJ family protein [Ruminococcus sp.]